MSMEEETIAVCFCGAAKTTSLGIPLVAAMWAAADDLTRALIQIPVLLYTIEQVSQFLYNFIILTDIASRSSWRSYSSTPSSGTCAAWESTTQIPRRKQTQSQRSSGILTLKCNLKLI